MNTHVLAQTKPSKTSAQPVRSNVLQRKCACGGTPGPAGECEECRKKRRSGLQTKLKINAPGDVYEQEADRIANQVLATPARPSIAQAPLRIQRLSGKATGQMDSAPTSVDAALAIPGRPLELTLRQDMEQRFGHDFSRVRIHSDAAAEQSTREVNANAYTVGPDIVFGAGQFSPHSPAGRRLLSHELTHVVQQENGSHLKIQRQFAGCQSLIPAPAQAPGVGIAVHRAIEAHFARSVRGVPPDQVRIPGASAAPGRTQGICGRDEALIKPQKIGGQAGDGLPDLARIGSGGVLQVAEIKPATEPCLIDGETQLARYIDQGNARDAEQEAWRNSLGIKVVSPMLENSYAAPTLPFGTTCRIQTAWCTPGLLAYAVICPRRRDDDRPPIGPPIWVRPSDQPGSSETKGKGGDQPGKGDGEPGKGDRPGKTDGEPGKGDRGRRPGRTPGRDQPQQPTFRLPDWVPGAALLALLAAIVALASRNPLGRLAAFLGTLLGRLLSALGLSIGVFGGTVTAAPSGDGGPGPGAGDKTTGGGEPPTGPAIGGPVTVPGGTVTVPGGTVTVPRGTDLTKPPVGTTPQPGGTIAPPSPSNLGSVLGNLVQFLLKLLGIDPAVTTGATGPTASGSGAAPQAGIPTPRTTEPPTGRTPPPTGGTIAPKPQKPPYAATQTPSRRTTVRPTPSRAVSIRPGTERQTAKTTVSSELPKIEVGSIEGVDLEKISVGWYSFVHFDPGKSSEKLVLLGLIAIHPGDAETIFEFRSGEGECSREGCSGSRNTYIMRWPPRPSDTPKLNGLAIYSQLKGFFPHEKNLDDLADALDAAGKGYQAETIRRLAKRQAEFAQQKNR